MMGNRKGVCWYLLQALGVVVQLQSEAGFHPTFLIFQLCYRLGVGTVLTAPWGHAALHAQHARKKVQSFLARIVLWKRRSTISSGFRVCFSIEPL